MEINHSLPVKLWISDILTVPKHSSMTNVYIFKGRLVQSVDIMGVITSRETHNTFFIYVIDDGTGCIKCKVNKNSNFEDKYDALVTLKNEVACSNHLQDVKQAMNNLISQTMNAVSSSEELLNLGTSVHIIGKMYEFHGDRQIFVLSLNIVDNIFNEADRTYEMCDLYTLYTKSLSEEAGCSGSHIADSRT